MDVVAALGWRAPKPRPLSVRHGGSLQALADRPWSASARAPGYLGCDAVQPYQFKDQVNEPLVTWWVRMRCSFSFDLHVYPAVLTRRNGPG